MTATAAVIVTGASSGIGAAIARRAGARRMVFVGYDRGAERAERVVREIRAGAGRALAVRLPLADLAGLAEGVDAVAAAGEAVDALVLNAAPAPDVSSLLKVTADQFQRQLAAAVVGNHALLAQVWRRFFRPRGGGHVVAVLSAAAGADPTPHMAPYVVAKAALDALVRCAAAELGRAGLAVSTVAPPFTETPMLAAFDSRLLEARRQNRGPFLTPERVAEAVAVALDAPPPPGRPRALAMTEASVP